MSPDKLSLRLNTVASMVTRGNTVYDIGCDHAWLSVYLVKNGIADRAYACDIRPWPLMKARENIISAGLNDRIDVVQSNGLQDVPEPTGKCTLIIAGMGGPLIMDILQDAGDRIALFDEIIISPQSLIPDVRANLARRLGLYIADEELVSDADKYYVIMKLSRTPVMYSYSLPGLSETEMTRIRNLWGPVIIDKKPRILYEYLKEDLSKMKAILEGLDEESHPEEYRRIIDHISYNEKLTGGLYGNDQNR